MAPPREPALRLGSDESSRRQEEGGLSHPGVQLGPIPSRRPSSHMPPHLLTNLNLLVEKVAGADAELFRVCVRVCALTRP